MKSLFNSLKLETLLTLTTLFSCLGLFVGISSIIYFQQQDRLHETVITTTPDYLSLTKPTDQFLQTAEQNTQQNLVLSADFTDQENNTAIETTIINTIPYVSSVSSDGDSYVLTLDTDHASIKNFIKSLEQSKTKQNTAIDNQNNSSASNEQENNDTTVQNQHVIQARIDTKPDSITTQLKTLDTILQGKDFPAIAETNLEIDVRFRLPIIRPIEIDQNIEQDIE